MIETIDESKLSPVERIALAAYRLNRWEWDDMLGRKPKRFDTMTIDEKQLFILPQYNRIKELLGDVYLLRCFWIFDGETEEEWLKWRKSQIVYEKEYDRYENAQRPKEDGKKLQPKIASVLAFCAGFCFGSLLLFVLKALHGGFAA
mgnify:CR=1 FL=1